jgi:hypothetical protein
VKAGESFIIPAGVVHNATNRGTGVAKIVATYVIEKGKPLAFDCGMGLEPEITCFYKRSASLRRNSRMRRATASGCSC